MLTKLIEKRTEFVAKRTALEAARQAEIDAKVNVYRASLEESTSKEEIVKVDRVISALDEVIGYESLSAKKESATSVDVESVMSHATEARPGMAAVIAPTR